MGGGITALKAGSIQRRSPPLARAWRRWAIQDLITAGTDELIQGQGGGGHQPGRATVVPVQQPQRALGQEEERGAQLGGAHD